VTTSRILNSAVAIIIVIVTLYASPAQSQRRVELAAMAGYRAGGGLNVEGGDLKIENSPVLTAALDIRLTTGVQLELAYSRQDTKMKVEGNPLGGSVSDFDMAVIYYQAGLLIQARNDRALKPFALVTLGATQFVPEPADFGSETRFSMVLGGGLKLHVAGPLALRAQASLLHTFVNSQGEILCAGSAGCFQVSGGNLVIQADASLGVILAF